MEIEIKGHYVLIDDDDFNIISNYKWYPQYDKNNRIYFIKNEINNNKKTTISLHRTIMGLYFGNKNKVDHINGNTLDNRKCNLRLCNNSQNQMNRGKPKNNTSGYKGVYFNKIRGKWVASIKINNKRIYIGAYNNPIDAHKAYLEKEKILFGEFVRNEQE